MPVESQLARIVRERRLRRARPGRIARPVGRILLLAAGVFIAAGAAMLASPLPLPDPDLQSGSLPQGARFYDRTGKLLIEAGSARAGESRWYAAGSAPQAECVLPAFLAARNLTLSEIRSPDLLGAVRAFADSLAGVKDPAGDAAAELLAMRGSESGVLDKARLAGALAARYDRLELAEWMINIRLYGNGTVGVDDAALTYFGAHAGALSAGPCAALEALAADPALAENPAGWNIARDAILGNMLSGGFLEKADWERALAAPIPAAALKPSMAGAADPVFGGKLPILDSFLELVLERLSGRFPETELPRSGIRVFTTMDLDFELQLLCAAQNLLAPPEDPSSALPTLEGKPCDMAALLGPAPASGMPADLALAVIDPATGEVLAYFDSARGEQSIARGPAGTALLPFVYLSAFARGYSPASMLLDAQYLASRARLIDPQRAQVFGPGYGIKGGTIYLSAADESGMMVSFIQSNYMGFGSGVVEPTFGVSLQNRGHGFSLDARSPNVVAPGKRPFHTIIPGFLTKGGRPLMSFGVMGGNMQPQGHIQTLVRMLDHGQNLQAACDAPRWRFNHGLEINVERAMPAATCEALSAMGHQIVGLDDSYMDFGAGQFIWRLGDPAIEGYVAASDPRRDGAAVGF